MFSDIVLGIVFTILFLGLGVIAFAYLVKGKN